MPARTRFIRLFILLPCLAGSWSSGAIADTRTYQATTDFPVLDAGAVPYYSEAPGRPSLAINAAIESYRDVFARATVVYDGTEGVHDFTLVALAELDGEADYQLLINGVVVGTATNPEVEFDYTVVRHSFPDINVPAGAVLAVESLANTNGKIPEGDGTAFARGRWTTLELKVTDSDQEPVDSVPTDVDLELTMSSDRQMLVVDEPFTLELSVSNADNSVAATQPVIRLNLPLQRLTVVSADQCIIDPDDLVCSFPEIPSGTSQTMALSFSITDDSAPFTVMASASADQTDRDGRNNVATISVDMAARDSDMGVETETESETGTETENESQPQTQNQTFTETENSSVSKSSSSGGGSASLLWFLLLLPVALKARDFKRYLIH